MFLATSFISLVQSHAPTITGNRPGMTKAMDVRHINESIWIRRRAPYTMSSDEGAHYLGHLYDALLTAL